MWDTTIIYVYATLLTLVLSHEKDLYGQVAHDTACVTFTPLAAKISTYSELNRFYPSKEYLFNTAKCKLYRSHSIEVAVVQFAHAGLASLM